MLESKKKKSVNIFIPIDDYNFVKELAIKECRTMSLQIAHIINKYREQHKRKAVDSLRQPYND